MDTVQLIPTRSTSTYDLSWATKNPALFVAAFVNYAEQFPATGWNHYIAFQPPGKVEITAVKRTEGDKLRVAIDVDWGFVTNAIIGALEGGSGYWCREYDYIVKPDDFANPDKSPLYACDDFWRKGGVMLLKYDNPEAEGYAQKHVSESTLRFGLRIMSEKYPSHFGDLVSENDDATTHDVLLQCVLFGEVIYAAKRKFRGRGPWEKAAVSTGHAPTFSIGQRVLIFGKAGVFRITDLELRHVDPPTWRFEVDSRWYFADELKGV